jgi:hypothetical protein
LCDGCVVTDGQNYSRDVQDKCLQGKKHEGGHLLMARIMIRKAWSCARGRRTRTKGDNGAAAPVARVRSWAF